MRFTETEADLYWPVLAVAAAKIPDPTKMRAATSYYQKNSMGKTTNGVIVGCVVARIDKKHIIFGQLL